MALAAYKYDAPTNGLAAETVYDANTNKPFSSGDDFLKAGGDWNSIQTRPVVPVNVNPSTQTTSDAFAKPPKTNLDVQSLIAENQKLQQQYLSAFSTPDPNIQAKTQELYGLQNQARSVQLNAQAGMDQIENQPIAMPFITGQKQVVQNNANRALQTNALQQQPLVQQLEILSGNRNQMLKAYEMALSFGKDDIGLAMQLQQMQKEEQNAAKQFALEYAVEKPFYTVDGTTIYRTSDGKAYSTLEEWQQDGGKPDLIQTVSPQTEAPTDDIAEYEYAVASGYQGSFMDYIADNAAARRAPSRNPKRSPNSDFTDSQLARGAAAAGMSLEAFAALDEDTQNSFINGGQSDWEDGRLSEDDFNDFLDEIDAMFEDGLGIGEIREEIDNSDLPQADKEELKQYAEENAPSPTKWYNPLTWF